jgi:hypothetical protein
MNYYVDKNGNCYYGHRQGTDLEVPMPPSDKHRWDFINNKWIVDNEKAWAALRDKRDQLLAESDWTQVNDSPLSSQLKAAWATYRQALRDVPSKTVDPLNPIWPTKPQ